MPSVFSLIGSAWQFYRKQPVLNIVLFWLLFLPPSIFDLVTVFAESAVAQGIEAADLAQLKSVDFALTVLAVVFLIYFTIWGQASVLVIGKRIISSPAGRNRTSFKAVRSQARKFIGPLLLTGVLRFIIAAVLCIGVVIPIALSTNIPSVAVAILVAVALLPGFIYGVQTAFYDIIIVSGKQQYFDALKESRKLMKGKTIRVLGIFLGVAILLLGPTVLFDVVTRYTINQEFPFMEPYVSIVSNGISSFALMLLQLSAIYLYKELAGIQSESVS